MFVENLGLILFAAVVAAWLVDLRFRLKRGWMQDQARILKAADWIRRRQARKRMTRLELIANDD